jgi:hypothetical protein
MVPECWRLPHWPSVGVEQPPLIETIKPYWSRRTESTLDF